MGRKGLSRDEKLQRLQELLHETQAVFTLKELEKRAYKDKGIVRNTVKEIAQELVDDGLVMLDKIGTSNYYWSFPSQALLVRKAKREAAEERLESAKRKRDELEEQKGQLEAERADEERDTKLARMAELEEEEGKLDEELQLMRDNDPELIAAIRADLKQAKQAVERWTDNIFTLKDFCYNKLNIQKDAFDANFQTTNVDYVE